MEATLIDTIPVRCSLGESPVWDWRTKQLFWTDIHERRLYRYDLRAKELVRFSIAERLCSFGLSENPEWLVCAFESGFGWFRPEDGTVHWLAAPEKGNTGRRFNDGRIDAHSRFWCGTLVEDELVAGPGSASLFVPDAGQTREVARSSFSIFNGCCWSPDNQWMYFADSEHRTTYKAAFDLEKGEIGEWQTLVETNNECPDGAVTDTTGRLWSAHWGGGRVCMYSDTGERSFALSVPARQPSCVTFCGNDSRLLAVTSVAEGLAGEQLGSEEGFTFLYEVSSTGVQTPIYARSPPQ